ncbi:MAG: tetratricopeptide repeat protein [Sphingomonadales bacterium]|nr:tetratricopeptide repeat protein [Sphingomonadales bacterium]NCO49360.1 tetratricopeptide repeat protein [Sphingomonadales bacterium]NCP00081.1 tetratricopeptide repeat protein [Sphingomonadales bacterium]NCP27226.1 tetratricopeptide repeat protein [Sphingomonadales bacterium]NCP43710.1 tetratricopeptide repeat protein [Sphingomonadales bacterium]
MNRLLNATTTVTGAILLALTCFSGNAQAEILVIDGMTPANSPEFTDIQSITIDRFGGRDGRALAFEVEDRLSAVTIFGQPYFDVIGGRSAVEPDASLSGNVTAGIDQYETVAKRRRCIERDDKDKCVTYKNIDVDCVTRTIDFRAQVRGTRYSDGRSLYTESFPHKNEQTVCFGDDQDFASSESVIRTMLSDTANAIRNDLAPAQYRQEIRILESRKGMSKAEGQYFKAAVKMTKNDPQEACRMWDEAAANGMVHISLLFNRALCAEQRGELEAALALYEEAERLSPGKIEVTQSLQRVSDHQRALDEWALRQSGGVENQR